MDPIALHEATKAALSYHWQTCPYRCTTNHIKCHLGWQLIWVEQAAWRAARTETLGTNAATGKDPQPVPHEPCCTTVVAADAASATGGAR